MKRGQGKLKQVEAVIFRVMSAWYERVKEHYVTDDDSKDLGVEPEIKFFQGKRNYRIKFSRQNELDVTYGLAVEQQEGQVIIVASVNNKSAGFDFDSFVEGLKTHYWKSRNEKPWTDRKIDHFAYGDLLDFEPRMGKSVTLDIRKDKADIIRLYFGVGPQHEKLVLGSEALLRDLIEDFCLNPLKRIYAESYREQ
jgi:hypothetical protein